MDGVRRAAEELGFADIAGGLPSLAPALLPVERGPPDGVPRGVRAPEPPPRDHGAAGGGWAEAALRELVGHAHCLRSGRTAVTLSARERLSARSGTLHFTRVIKRAIKKHQLEDRLTAPDTDDEGWLRLERMRLEAAWRRSGSDGARARAGGGAGGGVARAHRAARARRQRAQLGVSCLFESARPSGPRAPVPPARRRSTRIWCLWNRCSRLQPSCHA